MQNEFTENLGKLCQAVSKPMMDLTQLNITTLSNMTKNIHPMEELAQAKKPEEILAAQVKLANNLCVEATKYTQKAMEISLVAMSEAGKVLAETLNKTTTKATEYAKQNNPNKVKE